MLNCPDKNVIEKRGSKKLSNKGSGRYEVLYHDFGEPYAPIGQVKKTADGQWVAILYIGEFLNKKLFRRVSIQPKRWLAVQDLMVEYKAKCPNCNKNKKHGAYYSAGFWGYVCDPINTGRDIATVPFVYDISEKDEQKPDWT